MGRIAGLSGSGHGEAMLMDELQAQAAAALNHVLQHRETYLKAWVAETGVLPSDACLLEQPTAFGAKVQVALRREVADAITVQCIDPVKRARALLEALSDKEYLEALPTRCFGCGSKATPCHCDNDD